MSSEQKSKTQPAQQTIQKTETSQAPGQAAGQPKKSNAALWVLVGCLGIFFVTGLVILGLIVWGGWHLKKRIDEAKPEFEKWQQTADEMRDRADQFGEQMDSVANQMDAVTGTIPQTSEEPSAPEEKAVGYIKNVYEKSGKRYIDIDYIQWLSGAAAERAMREDGQCLPQGECIVANDYYIRNQNPRLRTFEISPQAKIYSQTIGMREGGLPRDREITFATLKGIFGASSDDILRDAPYGIEISGGAVSKITQYYIP